MRPCCYCGLLQSNLKRHMLRKHQNCVGPLLFLSPKKQKNEFAILRSQGIKIANGISKSPHEMMRERKTVNFKNSYECESCGMLMKAKSRTDHVCPKSDHVNNESFTKFNHLGHSGFPACLYNLLNDETGSAVRDDRNLHFLGREFYNKFRNEGKLDETETKTRDFMRVLTKIKKESFGTYNYDMLKMFDVENVQRVIDTIEILSTVGDKRVHSKIVHYTGLVKIAAEVSQIVFYERKENDKAEEAARFLNLFSMKNQGIMRSAIGQLNIRRQEISRAPENQVDTEHTMKLSKYLTEILDEGDCSNKKKFRIVQNGFCTLLTLFNGRRGGEPCRMTLAHAELGLKDYWIRKDLSAFSEEEREAIKSHTLIIVLGKVRGTTVDTMFPKRYDNLFRKLMDEGIRSKYGIHKNNPFVFASGAGCGMKKMCPQSAVRQMKQLCGVPLDQKFDATAFRHAFADIGAHPGFPVHYAEALLRKLGHTKQVHDDNYRTIDGAKSVAMTYGIQKWLGIVTDCVDSNLKRNKTVSGLPAKPLKVPSVVEPSSAQPQETACHQEPSQDNSDVEDEYCPVMSESSDSSDTENVDPLPKKKKVSWSRETDQLITRHFADEIHKKKERYYIGNKRFSEPPLY